MVYDNKFEILDFSAQADIPLPDPKVVIEFNGSGIHKIAGPTPLISFNSTYNRSPVGQLESVERKITLEGKIVRSSSRNFSELLTPSTTGVQGLVGAHEQLKELFGTCSAGTLSIYCDGQQFFEKHNVKVESIDFSSDNNFIKVADYTINLSFYETGVFGFAVRNTTDEWNIEPLEDYLYIDYTQNVQKKDELHNPHINASVPVTRDQPYTDNTLSIIDVPRYKISRKLSAEGLPPTGATGCTDAGVNTAYIEAKNWVESRLVTPFNNSLNQNDIKNSGLPAFTDTPEYSLFGTNSNTYLYNHVRSINYSISQGSYAVSESWLAMPTGIRYTEDFDIDVSTDESFIKSVTIKGEIQGLYCKDFGNIIGSGSGLPPNDQNYINLDNDVLVDATLGGGGAGTFPPIGASAGSNVVKKNKYENALSGFLYDIKPYLYSRASIGINSIYTEDWLDMTTADPNLQVPISQGGFATRDLPGSAPQIRNPTYTKERSLNIIPTSTSEAHNLKKGSLSYSYQFNNKPNIVTGVISSNITVDTTFPNDVFAESFVLGRSLGPVLQDLGTVTTAKKNISIEVSVIPPSEIDGYLMSSPKCPLWESGYIYMTITGIIESLKPYGDRPQHLGYSSNRLNEKGKVFVVNNQENWNPLQGKYSLNLGYVYQPCNVSRGFRDS